MQSARSNQDSRSHRDKQRTNPISISLNNDDRTQLLTVLCIEGVVGAQGEVNQFYARLGELEQYVDLFCAFNPIKNPLRDKKRALETKVSTRQTKKADHIKKKDRQRIRRLLNTEFWKIKIYIHVKSEFITKTGDISESQQKLHKERVRKTIGAWEAEFRPSTVRGIIPRRVTDLYPTTSSGRTSFGSTNTIQQLTQLPPRLDLAPTPTFELPPELPTNIILGQTVAPNRSGNSTGEPVGLPIMALSDNLGLFTINQNQKKGLLKQILEQAKNHNQATLILDISGRFSTNESGYVLLKPGFNFFMEPLATEGLSPEQYTELFIRALNLYCELPENRIGELGGLLLDLYKDLETPTLQKLHQTLTGSLFGEFLDDDPVTAPPLQMDSYNLRSIAALLAPLLHGITGAAFSADPRESILKVLEPYFESNQIVVLDFSRFTPGLKKLFTALITIKLLASRRKQLDRSFSHTKHLNIVLDNVDLLFQKGDFRVNQRLDNYLSILMELKQVNIGLIGLGSAPEVLWGPAFSLINRNLILSQIMPNSARFIERYLDLSENKYDWTKRKFLQRLGGSDGIILVKRSDLVEPFLCKFNFDRTDPVEITPLETPSNTDLGTDILLNQTYDLSTVIGPDLKYIIRILNGLDMYGGSAPYLAVQGNSVGLEGGKKAQIALLTRMQKYGLLKEVSSRGMTSDRTLELTAIGRIFLKKHQPEPQSTVNREKPSQFENIEPESDKNTSIDQSNPVDELPDPGIESMSPDLQPETPSNVELDIQPTRTRLLAIKWVTAKTTFRAEDPEAWGLLRNTLIQSLSDLYEAEWNTPPNDLDELLQRIQQIPELDSYLYPELEEIILSPETEIFDPEVFTADILQQFEDLFACGSDYPRAIQRINEIETLTKTRPTGSVQLLVSLITELFGILINLEVIPRADTAGNFLEAFSRVGVFIPHKKSLREIITLHGIINRGEVIEDLVERCETVLENFQQLIKDLEIVIFDIDDRMAAELRQSYNQIIQEDNSRVKLVTTNDQTSNDDIEEDEVLSDLLAVGSEELVLIDCGRFIREGIGAILDLDITQINLDRGRRFLHLILEDSTLNIPFTKNIIKILDSISFLIETGELPPVQIRSFAQIVQKFAHAMKTSDLDPSTKSKLIQLFKMTETP